MNPTSNHDNNHGSAPASPSPSMSQSQQQAGQSRQPVSYPSPTSYPSPGLSSAQYSYPAPNQQQGSEPYRASPTGSNGSVSLPSMRSLDPLQHQQQTHQHMAGSPLPPPGPQMGAPYYHSNQTLPHPSHQYPNVTSDPSGQNMRYALPQTDNRVMSGGRHKKEIKRRTKTGCLTCRKRRIKCDEAHPACRNCQKSKRECLGYDPIFKQQPGPSPIQPAPSSAPSQASTLATANPYGNQPMMQGYPNMGYDPALSAGVSSPGSGSQQFDYASAIDPALEAVAPGGTPHQFQQTQPGMPNLREDMKAELHSSSPYSSGASDTPHLRGGAGAFASPSNSVYANTPMESHAYGIPTAKRFEKIEELLALTGNPSPPPITTNNLGDPSVLDEIKLLYHSIYSPGLESFIESKWFSVKGVARLLSQTQLLEQFAAMLQIFAKTSATSATEMAYTAAIEARLVWQLLCMTRNPDGTTPVANGSEISGEQQEASSRLAIIEYLLLNQTAGSNPLPKPPQDSSVEYHIQRSLDFWYTLGQFVTVREDPKQMDEYLASLRLLLDGRENRDVLYSIALVRGLSDRVAEYQEVPLHLDETDNRSKLAVAKKFIKDEGNNGTTNVTRRLSELATKSWDPTAQR